MPYTVEVTFVARRGFDYAGDEVRPGDELVFTGARNDDKLANGPLVRREEAYVCPECGRKFGTLVELHTHPHEKPKGKKRNEKEAET